ncbi:hypothetical protein ACN08X_08235 [Rothia sp. P6271]|uniref:hypothetical protein n=1 Tax=unclassified Rothia (in: high G+C Gram-positive bacteria) TaxID=2689056 RepID=UPI003AD4E4C5
MAEHIHQVPEKYGEILATYHPRISSYHRRLIAAVPPSLVIIAIGLLLARRRLALPYTVILVFVVLAAALSVYSFLKPTIAVRTKTHFLMGRTFGWRTIELNEIHQTIFAERLIGKKSVHKAQKGLKSLGHRGVPALWATNAQKKRIFRMDGRIWDKKTMKKISGDISPQTVMYPNINVLQMNKQHPGLVSFNELHPQWRSTLAIIVYLLLLSLVVSANFLPTEVLEEIHLL